MGLTKEGRMPFIVSGLVLHTFISSIQEETKVSRGLPQAPGHLGLKSDPVQKETDRSCTHLEMWKVNCNFSTLRNGHFFLWGRIVNVM